MKIVESRKSKPFAVRFWSRVRKSEGCWLWSGTTRNGYGTIKVAGVQTYAHRVSWLLHRGDCPEDLCVLHKCDTPRCVNPGHLFLGTRKDNAEDCAAKGRNVAQKRPEVRQGERASRVKLTASQVAAIRQRYAAGGVTYAQLATEYGVERSTVGKIVTRRLWGHL